MTKSEVKSEICKSLLSIGELADGLTFCTDPNDEKNIVELNGQKFTPDGTKGYLKFKLSHSFPVVTSYKQGIHPNVINRSYKTMLHQNLNSEHQLVAYDPQTIGTDKILGAIVAVDFPSMPNGGWTINKDPANAPGITAVATFAKLARGADRIVGRHLGGRHKYAVSMEVQYPYKECAFAIEIPAGKEPLFGKSGTPGDMLAAGWEYIPWVDSPDALLETFSIKKRAVTKPYKNRNVVQMIGGLDHSVHYTGVGVVLAGAEREAEILHMAASQKPSDTLAPLFSLAGLIARK